MDEQYEYDGYGEVPPSTVETITYRHSAQMDKLFAALSKAQAEMEGARKDATNPHFRSKYADLGAVWDACREALTKNGLCVLQPPFADGKKVTVTTVLGHSSGQWFAADLTMTSREDSPQGVGSTITYGRRYGLQCIAGIAPEDDDGNAGSGRNTDSNAAPPPVRQQSAPPPRRSTTMDTHNTEDPLKSAVRLIAEFKPKLGDKAFFQVLREIGDVDLPEDIKSVEVGRKVYKYMAELEKHGVPKPTGSAA